MVDAGPLVALAKVDLPFVPRRLLSRCRIPEVARSVQRIIRIIRIISTRRVLTDADVPGFPLSRE